jgi:hypothetical protein
MIVLHEEHSLVGFWHEAQVYHLDVRELLEEGGEPFVCIMDCVQQIAEGDTLVVHALFEPKPLVAHVERMGLQARCERIEPEHWTLTIRMPPDP